MTGRKQRLRADESRGRSHVKCVGDWPKAAPSCSGGRSAMVRNNVT